MPRATKNAVCANNEQERLPITHTLVETDEDTLGDEPEQKRLDQWVVDVAKAHDDAKLRKDDVDTLQYEFSFYTVSNYSNAVIVYPTRQMIFSARDIQKLARLQIQEHFFYPSQRLPAKFKEACAANVVFTVQEMTNDEMSVPQVLVQATSPGKVCGTTILFQQSLSYSCPDILRLFFVQVSSAS